ncbi:MAG: 16S rRNA (adenine(1518)-N(6)/adenine(1519)-N(6))-dimethyltransferase RsmA [Alphaproteobacteria bacterium]
MDGLPPLREIIDQYDLRARKSLGQNFLLDLNLTDKIARMAAPLDNAHIYEVGPGPGGLTRALLFEGAQHVTAIDPDRRAIKALTAYLQPTHRDRLTLVEGDALTFDEVGLVADQDTPLLIVSNLPYNVATVLLFRWLAQLHDGAPIRDMILMFQREVAQRITAQPGSKTYGRLSILAQWLCQPEIIIDLPPEAFSPPPKVSSAVVRFNPRPEPLAPAPMVELEAIVAAAFGQRRKMLRQSLKTYTEQAGIDPARLLDSAGIDPTARAETLSIEQFCALARAAKDLS